MGRRVATLIFGLSLLLHAQPARAVDATGTWAVSFDSGGIGCFAFTGTIVATSTTFELTSWFFNFSGTIDPVTGQSPCGPGAGICLFVTDTSIAGGIDYSPCFGYSFTAVRVCPACDDGNPCTTDGCDGTACFRGDAPSGTACGGDNACISNPTCHYTNTFPVRSVCGGTATQCNDDNPCTDDACDSTTGQCVFTPNSDPCNDGNACTTGEHCSAGQCGGGTGCGPCDICGPVFGCIHQPVAGCRPTLGKSKIVLRDSAVGLRDSVAWTWGKGSATAGTDFGNPLAEDDYTLCVFDGPNPFPRLLLRASAPAGDTCTPDTSCWRARGSGSLTSGFTYTDRGAFDPDGVKNVKLKAGTDGRARATVKGQGFNLEMPSPLDVSLPVTVQLRGRNGACFEAKFDTAQQSRADLFRAVSSPP